MKQQLQQIYQDLSAGRLSKAQALEIIETLKRPTPGRGAGMLLASPEWQAAEPSIESSAPQYTEQHVLVCELPGVDLSELQALVPNARCQAPRVAARRNIAESYSDYAIACFETIQNILRRKPRGKVLAQLVLPDVPEQGVLLGLSALLKTVALENPSVQGQCILVPRGITTTELAKQLRTPTKIDTVVRYVDGVSQVRSWRALPATGHEAPIAFKDRGVYLITGGLGGLGLIFAKEILRQTSGATLILAGRSPAASRVAMTKLAADPDRIEYRSVDVSDPSQIERLIAAILERHGQLNGIIHSAGVTADNFILKKGAAEFRDVLAPKVSGTFNLDVASRDVDLDFLVLFSSIAAVMGNAGQADYAAANGFMDQFAAHRNRGVAAGERRGRTVSINWPFWSEGGMALDERQLESLQRSSGIQPMQTSTGIQSLYQCLQSPHDQVLVMEGELAQLHRVLTEQTLHTQPAPHLLDSSTEPVTVRSPEPAGDLLDQTQEYLRGQFSTLLKLPAQNIDVRVGLDRYGIDSILAVGLINRLEGTFGALSKTLLFEYQSIQALAEYLVRAHATKLNSMFAPKSRSEVSAAPAEKAVQAAPPSVEPSRRRGNTDRTLDVEPIAIVGLSGRYPEAPDLETYWRNLRDGKDCIVEVPKDRWDWREYFSEDRTQAGRHYSRWGGFISGVDEFDPLFFNISPKEAKGIDPQERLFLQHAWLAIEDAGYTRASLANGQVGVYVGAMHSEYQLFGAEASVQGQRMAVSSSFASIANRVSYALNLHGPSMTLDTMCSSSLTAIHIACQDLRQGRTSLAIAGGVNVSIHPNKYLLLSAGQFISGDGHCQSFGEGGDGYIPGEGVGALLLKRLSEAERDGNLIYGVIRGSALNHGGKTNGYTVPNPQAQSDVIREALTDANLEPRYISYIEAHGTGTKLGDPIEIAALSNAFRRDAETTVAAGVCAIGSAKSNIGHCESAAGIAGLTKVLLQMKHGLIAPSLHSGKLNPHIDFDSTPFVVNQSLREWERPEVDGERVPRIAGVSSFGAGGSNAHVIVEEYRGGSVAVARDHIEPSQMIVPLSAKTSQQLEQKARDLLAFISGQSQALDLSSLAYTLQVGRESLDERVGLLAGSIEQLTDRLQRFVDGAMATEGLYRGQTGRHNTPLSTFSADADFQKITEHWMADGKLSKLVECWVNGVDLSWRKFYSGNTPRLMSLPGYPFARERYWLALPTPVTVATQTAALLHPLVHRNTSTLLQQSFASTFNGTEAFLVRDASTTQAVLPEWITVEMMRAAVQHASTDQPRSDAIELRDIVWGRPIAVTANQDIRLAMQACDDDSIDIEIFTDSGERTIHCQALAVAGGSEPPARVDVATLKSTMRARSQASRPGVINCHEDDRQLLAEVRLDASSSGDSGRFALHPGLLKILAGLASDFVGQEIALLSMDCARFVRECPRTSLIWIRRDGPASIDIDVTDDLGDVSVQLLGLQYEAAESIRLETSAAVTRAKPREISLGLARAVTASDGDAAGTTKAKKVTLAATGDLQASGSASRVSVSLSDPASLGDSPAVASSDTSAVKLIDLGGGVYSLEIAATSGAEASPAIVESVLSALRLARQEAALKVLLITGKDGFWSGGRTSCNQAVERGLFSAVASFPYPVIAVTPADACGSGFLLASVCDLWVGNQSARYGYTDARLGLFPSVTEDAFFHERWGDALADALLYRTGPWTGQQLLKHGWTGSIVAAAQVETKAMQLAAELAQKSHTALRLLKEHLGRQLVPLIDALTSVEPIDADCKSAGAPAPIPVASPVAHISLEGSTENVAVVHIDAEAQSLERLIAGLANIFARIEQSSGYSAIVLTSAHTGFLPSTEAPLDASTTLELRQLLQGCKLPVITAFTGDAKGTAWLAGLWSDACVYQTQGQYCANGPWSDSVLASEIAAALVSGLGASLGQEACLTGNTYSGADLQARVHALTVAEAQQVIPQAVNLAEFWCQWPRETIETWKKARLAHARQTLEALPTWQALEEQVAATTTLPAPRSDAVSVAVDDDGVALITMHDRQTKNLFSASLLSDLKQAFAYVERTRTCKVVVLTGYDTYFASGGTKETLLAIQQGKAQFTDERIFEIALNCPLPVIAAMQGHAIGAGWSLGMFADLVVLGEESRFHSPYMGYGFTPGAGATLVFPRKIGHDLARETLLTAQEIAGHELQSRGLPVSVRPRRDVLPSAIALAKSIAGQPRERLMALKRQLTHALRRASEDVYRREVAMHEQTFVGKADTLAHIQTKFANAVTSNAAAAVVATQPVSTAAASFPAVVEALKDLLAHELHMPAEGIDEGVQFTDLGLDSITGVTWIRKINQRYGTSIEATKVYSYPTLTELSRLVIQEVASVAPALSQVTVAAPTPSVALPEARRAWNSFKATRRVLESRLKAEQGRRRASAVAEVKPAAHAIAVIGMAGQFPQANDLDQFWSNIAAGRDCISEVPAKRWRLDAHFQPGEAALGKTYSKWLGALENYDAFDPLFFNISPTEAECMDPQQRLFLQACWHGIENAGYDSQSLSGSRCGVFVGCAAGDYHQLPRKNPLGAQDFTGAATSILAARIAYFLNLRGPCISIDTACSSSLVAIASACDSLCAGTSDLALAGGVYVMSGPSMHVMTSQAGMLSRDGRCFTFDQRANGFVIGEGVAVVMLKRLADAERDGDRILGVIEGWGVNQDGRTNGITAPNEDSQARLLQSVYEKFQIDPAGIQLLEAHGTGTKLGDPIEVAGLKAAFKPFTDRQGYCALGSVKSNIGHCLTAAGVAGVTKLLLAMKHRQLPPAVNFTECNEHIQLAGSPFYVNASLEPWKVADNGTRRAAVSSFGFSGTNAHLVIAEYVAASQAELETPVWPPGEQFIVPLSARNEAQLKRKVVDLLTFLREHPSLRLADIAYTLQVARDSMAERIVFLVESFEELIAKVESYVAGAADIAEAYQGQARQAKEDMKLFTQDDDVRTTMIGKWLRERKLAKLAQWWAKGLTLDWKALYGEAKPRRIELPGYPFAQERFWIESTTAVDSTSAGDTLQPSVHTDARGVPQSNEATWDGLSYLYRWEECQDSVRSLPVTHQTVLIVCRYASHSFEATLRDHYAQKQTEVVLIRLADTTAQLSQNEWRCDVRDARAFETALQGVRNIDALYFLASSSQAGQASVEADAEGQLLRLVKYLKRDHKISGKVDTYLLTVDNHSLSGAPGQCSGAGAAGLGYSLAQGNYQFRVRNLDLSAQDLRSPAGAERVLASISREPPSDRGEIIKIQAGKRHRGTFFKLNWGAPTPSVIKQNGVYLIVGGSGLVGRIITRNLIQKYGATVVWLGRSDGHSPKVRAALRAFSDFSGKLHYLQADVLSLDSMRRAIATIKDRYSALHGAIFSGMVFGIDNSIDQISEADFETVVAVKTSGGRVFHAALDGEPLDFMVYFSSGQAYAFSGASTVAAYAAGISAADSFTRSIQSTTNVPVGTINWGAWRAFVKERMEIHHDVRAKNVGALEDDEGFACFERFLGALQQGTIHQLLCMRISDEVRPLINCNSEELVTLAAEAPFTGTTENGTTELQIDPPRERIAQLIRIQQASDLDDWFAQLLFYQLNRLVESSDHSLPARFPATVAELIQRCRILDKYAPWVNESLQMLAARDCIELRDGAILRWDARQAKEKWHQWQTRQQDYAGNAYEKALAALVTDCLVNLPDILKGYVAATDVIFPNSSTEKVAALYKDNAVADTYNAVVADAVLACLQQRLQADPTARLRILEIGAGTGGTSATVFAKLQPFQPAVEEYCYTDLSKAFFLHAEENYLPGNPYIVCRRLDIEQPIEPQGIDIGSYDVVIATNVLHATRNIRQTLRNAKAALRRNGLLILNEISDKALPAHLTVALLDGWWLFQDPELRIPGCPGLYPQGWQCVLEEEGFDSVRFPAEQAHVLGNQVIIARSNGVIRQRSEDAARPAIATAALTERHDNLLPPVRPAPTSHRPAVSSSAYIKDTVLECLSGTLKIPATSIEAAIAFSDYGIDSILGVNFVKRLNEQLGIALNTAIIFEYPSLERLSGHILAVFGKQIESQASTLPVAAPVPQQPIVVNAHRSAHQSVNRAHASTADIAVVGMSGRFPKAESVREFWNNLISGVDGVAELPAQYMERGNYSARKQKGKTRCKWGGVLAERDCFDPLFFNISPNEAESMNPHQRLVMQESWNALEDAGYNPRTLAGSQTGVFVGSEPTGYQGQTFTGLSEAIIASRLSYVLNFNGPAFVVNTGCSSSGVAIHLACESLRNRETELALAGGVHACMTQTTQIRLDEIEMLSPSGRCFTFDAAGDGTIISEGAAMVVLKRLEDAIAAGDHVYGVIKGSGINQDGASNGITAPNGAAQEQLIRSVYDKFQIDPERISYVEAHGTGTKLGDPVETNALVRAFKSYTGKQHYCAVGSAKSHVGHTAAAAGVTGLIKVLLSMQHRQLPKLLNFKTLNPLIEFEQSPFYILTENAPWQPMGEVRMAAINSFGHSGTNVHMVVEEYPATTRQQQRAEHANRTVAVPLSAKTQEQLQQKCRDLLEFIESDDGALDLPSMAWTLQTGREAMEERLALVASSLDQLTARLRAVCAGESDVHVYRGRAQRRYESSVTDADGLEKQLQSWVQGAALDWEHLWGDARPERMSLPGYPFARERYWAGVEGASPVVSGGLGGAAANLPSRHDIEAIIDRIDDDSIDPSAGVTLLKMIV